MSRFFSFGVLLAAAIVVRASWADAHGSDRGLISLPPSYVELYRQIADSAGKSRKSTFGDALSKANANLRIFLRTGDESRKNQALKLFDEGLSARDFNLKDFHVLHPFGEMTLLFKQHHLLTPGQQEKLNAVAAVELNNFLKYADDSDNNIHLGQLAGYAGLLRYLDNQPFPQRAAAQARLEALWQQMKEVGDLDEDAANYDSLGIACLLDLARLLDHEPDLRASANFRRMFERQRDIVSPSGLIPEYGDSYFHYDACPMDRVYDLESAARIYNDPTFLYAARKLYQRPQAALPEEDYWIRALPLINMDSLAAAPVAPPSCPSQVTYRSRRGGESPLADKLILRTGLEPGSAMVMLDLYASGSHSHTEKGPSIAYFEADGVPLFHNFGRHGARSATTGNLLWLAPAGERFPGTWSAADEWITMSIPVSYLTANPDGKFVVAPSLSLRNFQERSRGCQYLFLDNLRLEGAAGTRLIDGFEDALGWDPRFLKMTAATNSTDKTQGNFSQRLAWKSVPSAEFRRKFPGEPAAPFTSGEFQFLKLDMKYAGSSKPYMHIRGLGRQMDLGDQMLDSRLQQAIVEQRGKDAYARIDYASYIRSDVRLTRQLVLTAEGCLIVRDTVMTGATASGFNAGQLWQFYELTAQGPNWFCGDDDGAYPSSSAGDRGAGQTRRMLVRFADAPGAAAKVQEIRQPYSSVNPKERPAERFFTAHSQRPILVGKKESFSLAVLPHDPQAGDPASIAGRLGFVASPEATIATLQAPAGKVEVRISDDAWEIRR